MKVKEIHERLVVLEEDNIVVFHELEDTQKISYANDQYIRRNNVEITGLPEVCDENLEEVVLDLVNKMCKDPLQPDADDSDDFTSVDIEACHRLQTKDKKGNKNTIVRFVNRRICEDIHLNKRNIKELKIDGLNTKNIYFNDNLCKHYKNLSARCRRLKSKKKIIDTWTENGIIKIKMNDKSVRVITHKNDLDKLFPDFVYFN